MDLMIPATFFIATAAASLLATGVVLRLLNRNSILDVPNERSSHSMPTPRGGGLAVVPVVLLAWLGAAALPASNMVAQNISMAVVGAAVLVAVSWLDDLKGLPPLVRLAAHFFAVGLALYVSPLDGLVFQGLLPAWLDQVLIAVLWVGFANIFNFMDGIDGISGAGSLGIGLGVAALVSVADGPSVIVILGAAIAGASLGFLKWNWAPAKIFLGDVGSVPLGFLLGWLLLWLAASGNWAAAIIIPLYYLADSGITLARRAIAGQRIWEAHKEHYYQRAVVKGRSHAEVSKIIGICNLVLILFALMSLIDPIAALAGGIFSTFVTLIILKQMPKRARP
jgi:UDP-N-acetylmuramyl pentapeptide phosphotransferase/UDP-N-acetylglucosamine-1-phosphate transferase